MTSVDQGIEAAARALEAEDASLDEAQAEGNFLVPEFRSLALARAAVIAYLEATLGVPSEMDTHVERAHRAMRSAELSSLKG